MEERLQNDRSRLEVGRCCGTGVDQAEASRAKLREGAEAGTEVLRLAAASARLLLSALDVGNRCRAAAACVAAAAPDRPCSCALLAVQTPLNRSVSCCRALSSASLGSDLSPPLFAPSSFSLPWPSSTILPSDTESSLYAQV